MVKGSVCEASEAHSPWLRSPPVTLPAPVPAAAGPNDVAHPPALCYSFELPGAEQDGGLSSVPSGGTNRRAARNPV
jgi:hypothetical protein